MTTVGGRLSSLCCSHNLRRPQKRGGVGFKQAHGFTVKYPFTAVRTFVEFQILDLVRLGAERAAPVLAQFPCPLTAAGWTSADSHISNHPFRRDKKIIHINPLSLTSFPFEYIARPSRLVLWTTYRYSLEARNRLVERSFLYIATAVRIDSATSSSVSPSHSISIRAFSLKAYRPARTARLMRTRMSLIQS